MDAISLKDFITVYFSLIRVWCEKEQRHGYKPLMALVTAEKSVDSVHWLFIRLCILVYYVELIAYVLFGFAKAVLTDQPHNLL